MVCTAGRANVAYCAKGPVGHGRTLLLHIGHGGELRISSSNGRVLLLPVKEADCLFKARRYVKSRREKVLWKVSSVSVWYDQVLERLKRRLCSAWQS